MKDNKTHSVPQLPKAEFGKASTETLTAMTAAEEKAYLAAEEDAAWERGFGALLKFKEREGHCRVPFSHRDENGYPLGSWVTVQRGNKDGLTDDRRRRLDALGFVWSVLKIKAI